MVSPSANPLRSTSHRAARSASEPTISSLEEAPLGALPLWHTRRRKGLQRAVRSSRRLIFSLRQTSDTSRQRDRISKSVAAVPLPGLCVHVCGCAKVYGSNSTPRRACSRTLRRRRPTRRAPAINMFVSDVCDRQTGHGNDTCPAAVAFWRERCWRSRRRSEKEMSVALLFRAPMASSSAESKQI